MADKKEKKYVSDNALLMAEWDWEKNSPLGLSPSELVIGCGKKAWWKCASGHKWQASIANRAIRNTGCPYCSGRKAIEQYMDSEYCLRAETNQCIELCFFALLHIAF